MAKRQRQCNFDILRAWCVCGGKTFTYVLPIGLQENVKTGARLIVPFGKRQLTGYAVALHAELDPELEIEASALKEAVELIDAEPLLTEEIVRLTQ